MKEKNTIRNSISIFLLCLAVHTFEVLVIRTDETFVAYRKCGKTDGARLCFDVHRIQYH